MSDLYYDAESCAKTLVQWLIKTTDVSTWDKSVLDELKGSFTVIVAQFLVNKEAKRDE